MSAYSAMRRDFIVPRMRWIKSNIFL